MCNISMRRSSFWSQDLISLVSSLRPCLSPSFPVVQMTIAQWIPLPCSVSAYENFLLTMWPRWP